IGHAAVEECLEELLAEIIVAAHILRRSRENRSSAMVKRPHDETGTVPEALFELRPETRSQELMQLAVLDGEVAVHEGFAEAEIAVSHNAGEQSWVVDAKDNLRPVPRAGPDHQITNLEANPPEQESVEEIDEEPPCGGECDGPRDGL